MLLELEMNETTLKIPLPNTSCILILYTQVDKSIETTPYEISEHTNVITNRQVLGKGVCDDRNNDVLLQITLLRAESNFRCIRCLN